MMRYFRLLDDLEIRGRWHLGEVRASNGREPLLDGGTSVTEAMTLEAAVFRSGRVLDFTLTSFNVPVATTRLAQAIVEVAHGDLECVPLVVAGQSGLMALNALRVVRCVDEVRSELIKWTEKDHRADKAGTVPTGLETRPQSRVHPVGCSLLPSRGLAGGVGGVGEGEERHGRGRVPRRGVRRVGDLIVRADEAVHVRGARRVQARRVASGDATITITCVAMTLDEKRLRANVDARHNYVRWATSCPECHAELVLSLDMDYGFVEERCYEIGEELASPPVGWDYSSGDRDERDVVVHSFPELEQGAHLPGCRWERDAVIRIQGQRIVGAAWHDGALSFAEEAFNGACTAGYLPCPYLVLDADGRPAAQARRIRR